MKSKTYKFYNDHGCAWLEVPLVEVVKAGIAGNISGYSYVSYESKNAYLEEDADASIFINAVGKENVPYTEVYEENIFIRQLPSFPGKVS